MAPPNVIEIANERVYGMHLRMLSKIDLRVQMDAKSDQLKIKVKVKFFSAHDDAQESGNGTTMKAFDVRLVYNLGCT